MQLSTHLSAYTSMYLSIHPWIRLPFHHPSIYPFTNSCKNPSNSPSINPSSYEDINPFISLSVHPSVHPLPPWKDPLRNPYFLRGWLSKRITFYLNIQEFIKLSITPVSSTQIQLPSILQSPRAKLNTLCWRHNSPTHRGVKHPAVKSSGANRSTPVRKRSGEGKTCIQQMVWENTIISYIKTELAALFICTDNVPDRWASDLLGFNYQTSEALPMVIWESGLYLPKPEYHKKHCVGDFCKRLHIEVTRGHAAHLVWIVFRQCSSCFSVKAGKWWAGRHSRHLLSILS